MIDNKARPQIYYTGETAFLKADSGPEVLQVPNRTYISASAVDDATVTFAQSASADGNSYIKITIGASTSTVTTSIDECANYLFWDTGFTGVNTPSICLTMECSGALESDLVTAANSGLPVVVYGWVWAPPGAVPMMTGKQGTDAGGDVINTGLAWRMGNGSDASVEIDVEHGNTNLGFAAANASRGGAAGCRGFRNKLIANTMVFDNEDVPDVHYYYSSALSNTPGTNCDGNNVQEKTKNTEHAIPYSHQLYIFLGAGNTATGGDACTFAGIFKARFS